VEILLTKLATALVLPPGVNLLAGVAGLVLRRRLRRTAMLLTAVAFASLYLLSTGALAGRLVAGLERVAPLASPRALAGRVDAIVVLGGGRNPSAPEYGGETVNHHSLVRARYGAVLQRASGLPLLVSGGRVLGHGTPEAELMAHVLTAELGVPVRWVETASRNTAENAIHSQRLLARADARRVALVTSAMHIARATEIFERVGLEVVPAPTDFHHRSGARGTIFDWLPTIGALWLSSAALHEYLGRLWYRLRY